MFGIVAMVLGEIFRFKEDRKEYVYNTKERRNPNKYGTYYDYKGRERDVKTNQPVYTQRSKNNDLIQKDKHGNIIRNISEEKRTKEFQEKLKDSNRKNTVYIWNDNDSHRNDPNENHRGYWHIDYETKDVYVVRTVKEFTRGQKNDKSLMCFMDINTGKIARITDLQREIYDKHKKNGWDYMTDSEIDDFIRRVNSDDGCFLITHDNLYYCDRGI